MSPWAFKCSLCGAKNVRLATLTRHGLEANLGYSFPALWRFTNNLRTHRALGVAAGGSHLDPLKCRAGDAPLRRGMPRGVPETDAERSERVKRVARQIEEHLAEQAEKRRRVVKEITDLRQR